MNTKIIGENLRKIRTVSYLSLQDVADKLGIQKGTLGNIERGDKAPSLAMLCKLAEYFCVSLDYLTGRSDDPEYEKFLMPAEQDFFNHPDTQPKLIEIYKHDKANNPISCASRFLRSCELIRDDRVQSRKEKE